MIGHLGSRVSALVDGQLSAADAERAWAHVYSCHACRDLVEREGWVKTRLAGLSFDAGARSAPAGLKGSLIGTSVAGAPGDAYLAVDDSAHRRRGLVAIGGAAGAAVMGVLVLGVTPASAPTIDRPSPVTSITQPSAPRTTPPSDRASSRPTAGGERQDRHAGSRR